MQISQKRQQIWKKLQELVPLRLAGSWDNVGVLVDPLPIHDGTERIFLTIDLTEAVLQEAFAWKATIIVAYHPPIFGGLKYLNLQHPKSRLIVQAIQAGIGIYSPHSALDAVEGGICDWLSMIFSNACIEQEMSDMHTQSWQGISTKHPIEVDQLNENEGAGRILSLTQETSLTQILNSLSQALSLDYIRVACPQDQQVENIMIERIALCPGAGASLFHEKIHAQLLFTGEMRHHDILAHVRQGRIVILTEHTRCERGYLPIFAQRLQQELSINVKYSTMDDDPLHLWQMT
jgi:dinuclear metal center YbgI/SA1388 family protein